MAAVRGARHGTSALASGQAHLAHQPFNAPTRVTPSFPAQCGMDPRGAVDLAACGKDTADMPAQVCFRLSPALNGGDRLHPGIKAADTDADDAAERGHGMVGPLGRHEGELRHAIPLAKKAAAFRRIWFSSSSRLLSRRSRCISASSALRWN